MYTLYAMLVSILVVVLMATPPIENPAKEPTPDIFFMSTDKGDSWQGLGKDWDTDFYTMTYWADSSSYYLATNKGVYTGHNKQPMANSPEVLFSQKDITGIYPGRHGLYAITAQNGFYEYLKPFNMWQPMHTNLEARQIHSLLETKDGDLYVAGDNGIYITSNHAKSWKKIADLTQVYSLMEKNGALFAMNHKGLWRSTDEGKNWNRALTSATPPFCVRAINDHLVVLCEGQDFAGVWSPRVAYQSKDNGVTWQIADFTLPASLHSISDLQQAGKYLFATSYDGIYRSGDQGLTWKLVLAESGDKGNFYQIMTNDNMLFAMLLRGC